MKTKLFSCQRAALVGVFLLGASLPVSANLLDSAKSSGLMDKASEATSGLFDTSALLKTATGQLSGLKDQLGGALGNQAGDVLSMLGKGKDLGALTQMAKLAHAAQAAKLTPGQKELVSEARGSVEALVLARNLDATDTNVAGPLTKAVTAARSGDHLQLVQSAMQIKEKGHLSDEQSQLVSTLLDGYPGLVKQVTDAAGDMAAPPAKEAESGGLLDRMGL